jgi:DNA-binding NarL/FixJ family response regulator
MKQYSITLVEDDDDVCERLAQLIEQQESFKLLATSSTYSDGLVQLLDHKPDILLTDLGLPDGSGIDLIKAIAQHQLDTLAMVVSGFQDEHHVFSALEAGAGSYIHKHDESQKITDAIHIMLQGGAPISPVISRLMLQKFQQPATADPLPESLTEHQVRILKFVSQGFSSREIAEKLDISYYTVTTHIKNIYTKLQVNSRTEALHEAAKLGLIR